ncbi:unnamed protein product (macronuclear) [Paramecium tetraurelia]|uniref:Uncharacterized protein n=1 Tax=Paramecium tetraurelia TaxID=5888 RepID=A0CA54_PARTE|nr:uncharacterized protein GSPATT00036451001 [Paramecium tetraurelia]CAK67671.1 unnamed protein product [Paramecium tetraurelia]|eukprot:XP_001435068.1 hypothetical protein (macronuclear) [Paramecium tetraurelia strain d4-2]
MQEYLKSGRSLHFAQQQDEFLNKKYSEFDPASFLNNFDALPDKNLRFKTESISLLTKQADQKKEMQKITDPKILVLPKINSKFIRDEAVEEVYFLPETKQNYSKANRLILSNNMLQPSTYRISKSSRNLNQLQAKKKRVEFNTALEIVDFEGRVSTEIISPEQQAFKKSARFSRLKTLEC